MSHNLLALASDANEAAIAYRDATDKHHAVICADPRTALAAAGRLAAAVDVLTGAVVEAENEAGLVVPIDSLTRLREIEDVAGHRGVTVAEAVVLLVNSALSGTFLDGYRSAIEELQELAAEHEHAEEEWRRIDEHEQFLASEGADHLYEGRGE